MARKQTRDAGGVVRGAVAGAAGTTALNAATYLDMVWRARPASTTPEQMIERIEEVTPVQIPGDDDAHKNRVSGLGPLSGIAVGVGTGAALGAARMAGWRPGPMVTIGAATLLAMVAANGPMTLLGVTDPRRWRAQDWAADVVPHLVYGIVTGSMLGARRRR